MKIATSLDRTNRRTHDTIPRAPVVFAFIYLGKLGAGMEEVGDEVVVDLSEGEVLGAVDSPGHVVTHTGVQT